MIRIGPAGIPLRFKGKFSTHEAIQHLPELGLNALEVQFVRGVKMSEEEAKLCRSNEIELSVHAPYFINLNAKENEKVEKSKERIIRSAELASLMGAKIVVFHPGYYMDTSPEEAYRNIKRALEDISSELKDRKLEVFLGPETMGKQKSFGTLEEILSLSEEVDGVKPVLDFSHIHARGNGSLRSREDFSRIFDEVDKRIGLEHIHSHFTGIFYENGNEKHHLTIDQGDLRFEHLAQEILDRGLDITIICESPVLEEDAMKMVKILRGLGWRGN